MNPSPPWIRGNACESCRKLKKACCKDPNGCSACKAKGVKCVYPQSITKATQSSSSCSRMATPSQTPLIQIKLPQPSTPSPPQPAFPSCSSTFAFELNQCNLGNNCIKKGPKQLDVDSISTCFTFPPSLQYCIQALDSNLIEKESRNWELVDPDQIPTIDDFQLSYSYLTTNGTTFPCHTPFDAEEFLMNYSQKSAALRLTFCAMAARETGRENLEIHYYRRACKALDRAADGIPSIELLQSYTNLYHFSTSKCLKL
ncbi:hypothetical protein BCR33DRAFT_418864 [Rhizoclosmatium globosum]|uniref:Zn(2)-C6 fungal-type domain-containing protein n=1 Tax=Rhizoclosmatium globosum TaxID=329046 RepID=A0A1Y2BWL6_9FUNG|nr:hypothetical protein BCR33DRAFT_418864 [Rhizoclosmatium globosum]|eukprot:ORY39152.1 hypothetical protein BCR33DRAFT_418864 [Rhizoclosmatium globosum]